MCLCVLCVCVCVRLSLCVWRDKTESESDRMKEKATKHTPTKQPEWNHTQKTAYDFCINVTVDMRSLFWCDYRALSLLFTSIFRYEFMQFIKMKNYIFFILLAQTMITLCHFSSTFKCLCFKPIVVKWNQIFESIKRCINDWSNFFFWLMNERTVHSWTSFHIIVYEILRIV